LFALSESWGTTVDELRDLNPGVVPEELEVGQVINRPCSTSEPAPSEPDEPADAPEPDSPSNSGKC
jgi:hypothetical protein